MSSQDSRKVIVVEMKTLVLIALILLFATVADATVYYVTKSGLDSHNCANPSSDACLTIDKGISKLNTGDTLQIGAGTYAETIGVSRAVPNGSVVSPTTIRNIPGETVWLAPVGGPDIILFGDGEQYVTISGINIDGTNSGPSSAGSTANAINLACNSCSSGDFSHELHNITVSNAEIKNTMGIGTWGNYLTFSYLTVHESGAGCFYNSGCHAIYLSGQHNVVEYNEFYNNENGVQIANDWSPYNADYNIIRYNKIHGEGFTGTFDAGRSYAGLIILSSHNNEVYDNLIWDNRSGILIYYGSSGSVAYNNTIYNNVNGGAYSGCINVSYGQATARNNICYSNNGNIISSNGGTVAADHNSFTNPLFASADQLDLALHFGSKYKRQSLKALMRKESK